MKKLKKLTAISLVFIMMLGLCVTSYSAVDTESSSKNTNAALAEELPAKRSVQAVQAVQPTENTSSTELSSIPAVEEEEPTKAEPKYLTLSQAVLSLGIGERYTLCCTLPDGSIASNISYSSNNSLVARVDFKTGEVIAAGTGTAQITAKTPGGTKAVCNITVGYAPSSIVINKTKLVLGIGEQFNLNSYLPSGCASYNTAYSTNNALVADVVKDNGLVTAKAVGTAKITVKTYNGKTAVCVINVKKAPKSISLNKKQITLGIGERFDLNSSLPSDCGAYSIVYSTNNAKTADVKRAGGLVTAKAVGTAKITVKTYNGKTAVCVINVKKAPKSISLNKKQITLGIGERFDLNSSLPSDCGAYSIVYSTNNAKTADVKRAGGLVTAKAVGTAKITVKTYNGKTAVCTFTVKPQAKSVTLNSKEIVMYVGEAFDLNSSIPKNTAAYYRLYSTSNAKTATVTRGGGIVKALKVGTATISCTLSNGKKAICKVYIMSSSKKIANVPLIGQQKLPTGCETCSAVMLLNYYGYNISETSFADKYLIKRPLGYGKYGLEGPDPNCAFIGSPYTTNSFGAYAPVMAKSMNSYLAKKSYKAVSVSGKSLEYLAGKYIAQGQPVMVWATIYMTASYKTTTWRVNYTDENARYKKGSSYTWLANEHCLLLTGYDSNFYYFNDPWTNSRIAYSKSVVNTRYNELGKQAVVMVKK
ncbi:MAG: Ig-like domain-containing protein [Lachnospiraceae bacterium]